MVTQNMNMQVVRPLMCGHLVLSTAPGNLGKNFGRFYSMCEHDVYLLPSRQLQCTNGQYCRQVLRRKHYSLKQLQFRRRYMLESSLVSFLRRNETSFEERFCVTTLDELVSGTTSITLFVGSRPSS